MSTLWTFGDSFTAGNGCLFNDEYTSKYKKSEKDKIWNDIIASEFSLKLKNLGLGLYSNDKIIDSVIKSYNLINQNDIVIIGITFYNRFDIPYNNELITLSPTNLPDDNNELLKEIIIFMDSDLLKQRQLARIFFLKNLLEQKGVKCLIWEVETQWIKYQNIKNDSCGEINDLHWSYNGHKEFATYIIEQIKKQN